MSNNPYKDYYDAMSSGDEWAYVRAAEIEKRIEEIREFASMNGISEEEAMAQMSNTDEMGG